jgi:mRNA interferase MazF
MQKEFQKWHAKKSQVEAIEKRPFFHERQIWYCRLGENVGFEQNGKGEEFLRPVLIVRKFGSQIFWAIPLTSAHKNIHQGNEKFYHVFSFKKGVIDAAILSQLRLVDAKRLMRLMGHIADVDFMIINKKIKALLP